MEWLAQIFRTNPVIPIFLTIGVGFWLGQLKYKSFSLGPVAATLLVGVAIGQLQIPISDTVKSIFFMLFLFAIGYSVGPQFFMSFRGNGIKQVLFAIVEAALCSGTVIIVARIAGYDMGVAGGLFAGSQTVSASLGLMSDTIRGFGIQDADKEKYLSIIPAAYAVTYVFGTIGSAWLLANVGPMLMGGLEKVKQETREIEAEMDSGEFQPDPGHIVANRPVSFRAYRVEGDFFKKPRTVREIESSFAQRGQRVFVERLRINGEICDASPQLKVKRGDIVVLGGRREVIIVEAGHIGAEVADHDLLTFGVENLPVTVSRSGADGMTFGELRQKPYMKGVLIRSIVRNGNPIPARSKTALQTGDVLTLVGLPDDVADAVDEIGYSDRQTDITDMVFLGLGIGLGCFVGAISIKYNGIPISLSITGGALVSGLFLGWLRNRNPSLGRIPGPVVWIFNNFGLNMFIAVVGITSGAGFFDAIRTAGVGLLLAGMACTVIPLFVSIFIARKIFHFSAPETLGCVAGARNGITSIGAIQDDLESTVPALGYTVTYAVANIALLFSSLLVITLC